MLLKTHQRGQQALSELQIDTQYPLGLFRAWAWVRTNAQVLVYPKPTEDAPPPRSAASLDQEATGERGQGADDFVGPRPYRPGDSPRRLDWKAAARERGLVTKQFGGEQAPRVWLDLHLLEGELEWRISTLTRQLLTAAAEQFEYGLRLGSLELPCDRGAAHQQRCLEALACFPADRTDTSR